MARPLNSREFTALLRRRSAKNAVKTDLLIQKRCAKELTVFMLDSSGFSRTTHERGIIHFLAVMTQAFDRILPVIRKHGGTVLSHGADNIAAVFPEPRSAARAALAAHAVTARLNRKRSAGDTFHVCVGLHHGPLLRLTDDVFGGTVNVAAKMGEDMAGKDETLVTRAVVDRLGTAFKTDYARTAQVGGLTFELYRLLCA